MAWHVRSKRKCPHCGSDPEECGDAEKSWYPQRTICYSTMESAAARWRYGVLHEEERFHDGTHRNWSKTRSKDFPYDRDDGVTIWVAPMDLNPEDRFLASANQCARDQEQREQDEGAADQSGQLSDKR